MDVNAETSALDASAGIEELLTDLTLDDLNGTENDDEVIEALTDSEEAAVEAVEAVEGAYAEQTTSTADVSAPPASEADAEPAKTVRKPREKKAAAPKAPRDLNSIDASVFVLTDGVTDLEANKAAVIALMPKQKKIAEKFENVFRSVAAGKAPSEFVRIGFKTLHNSGTMTSTELVAALKAAEYSEGTSRSQAGQIMALFPLLGVAKREGQKLTYNADAPMTKRLFAAC
jgi:hypothetical protein